MPIQAVVFDFGGVLFDWNPEYVYRELIPDAAERRWFLTHVCHMDWVVQQDGGQSIADGTAELVARFPQHEPLIRAFYERWHHMLKGTLEDGVALVEKLDAAQVPLFGLTNWSAETFPYAWDNFPVLRRFREIVVSGRVGRIKPDPAIFAIMFDLIAAQLPGIEPGEIVFIDDNRHNTEAANALGWQGVHHASGAATGQALRALGLPL